jgi:hypothetical protein
LWHSWQFCQSHIITRIVSTALISVASFSTRHAVLYWLYIQQSVDNMSLLYMFHSSQWHRPCVWPVNCWLRNLRVDVTWYHLKPSRNYTHTLHSELLYRWGTIYRMRHLMLLILSWQYCLCGLWEGSLTTVVGFRVALDSVKNEKLVQAAAHILCGRVRVKQVDHIRATRVSSEIWWWSETCTFKKNNRSVGVLVAWDWIRTG